MFTSSAIVQTKVRKADVDGKAFLDATGISDATTSTAIYNLVFQAKAHGWWTLCQMIYPFVGGTATTHKYNLKDPRDADAAFRLSFQGGWTHSSTGALPNSTTGYGRTFYTPSVNMASMNDCHLSFYSRSSAAETDASSYTMGATNNNNQNFALVIRRLTSNNSTSGIMGAASYVTVVTADGSGYFMGSRVSSTSHILFRNGTSFGSIPDPNTDSIPTVEFYIGATNFGGATGFSNRECAFITVGTGISSTIAASMYADVQNFQTALGRQV